MPPLKSSLKEKLKDRLNKSQTQFNKSHPSKLLNSNKLQILDVGSLPNNQHSPVEIKKSIKPKTKNHVSEVGSLTPLQQSMASKLKGAQFRWLNEQLYTLDSDAALKLIQSDPALFDIYHEGFRDQAQQWPEHPLSWILSSLLQLSPNKVIADMGCGDATLAQTLIPKGYTVYSYDLISHHPYVTQASMTHIPLQNHVCDIVVYCLSLMNTNYATAVEEGMRVLKLG
ncbi:25S rRNA (adenine645-N1)-methyltransferase, partial [Coelomomyces lativittatus]